MFGLIPVKRCRPAAAGRALFDGLAAPKQLWSMPQADHNDWMPQADATWWHTVIDFLLPGQERISVGGIFSDKARPVFGEGRRGSA